MLVAAGRMGGMKGGSGHGCLLNGRSKAFGLEHSQISAFGPVKAAVAVAWFPACKLCLANCASSMLRGLHVPESEAPAKQCACNGGNWDCLL